MKLAIMASPVEKVREIRLRRNARRNGLRLVDGSCLVDRDGHPVLSGTPQELDAFLKACRYS